MPDLTREEVERRLEETAYDLGHPESWADMHMDACQCSRCGRWLQIVRPGKWQCECDGEPDDKYREREALQTALSLYARAEAAEQERDEAVKALADGWDAAEKAQDALLAERDAFRAEALVLRTLVDLATPIDQPPVDLAPLIAAAAERWEAMEAATDMLRRIATGQVTPEAGRHGAVVLFRANPYFAARAVLKEAPDA